MISERTKTFVRKPSTLPPPPATLPTTSHPFVYNLFVCFCIRHLSYRALRRSRLEHFRKLFGVCAPTVYQLHRQPVGQANSNCPTARTLALCQNSSVSYRSTYHRRAGKCSYSEERLELVVKLETQLNAETQCVKMTDTSTSSSDKFGN